MTLGIPRCPGDGRNPHCWKTTPHSHCDCGLVKPKRWHHCQRCRAEGMKPRVLSDYDPSQTAWDGWSRPSYRRNRPELKNFDGYIILLEEILQPRFVPYRMRG
jgi:hypothetical protein